MGSLKANSYEDFISGIDEEKDVSQLKLECERLLNSSAYDSEYVSEKEKELWYYCEEELLEMKMNLLNNQVDRIEAGHNFTQTDIKRKLQQHG